MTQKGHHASGTETPHPEALRAEPFVCSPHRSALQPRSGWCDAPVGSVGVLRRHHYRRLPERYRNPQPQRYERKGDSVSHSHRNGY